MQCAARSAPHTRSIPRSRASTSFVPTPSVEAARNRPPSSGWRPAKAPKPRAPVDSTAARSRSTTSSALASETPALSYVGFKGFSLSLARDVDVAGSERPCPAGFRVVGVPPDAAGVVREQVDRDRRLGRGRPNAVDVVARRDQDVEVSRAERAPLDEPQPVAVRVDLLVLRAAVEA